jgi:hypothetical protein
MTETTPSSTPHDKPIKRTTIIILAIMLGLGLAWFVTLETINPLRTVMPLIALVGGGCFWVLNVPFAFRKDLYPLYASFILPVALYTSLLFFLREFFSTGITLILAGLSIPIWYLLFLSLSALEKYHKLPTHIGRVILNLLTLVAGYIGTSIIYRYHLPPWLIVSSVWLLMWLLFFQSMLWWTSGNFPYAIFYAVTAATIEASCSIPLILWPTGYLLAGFVLLLIQYNLMGIIQQYFKRELTTRILVEYLLVTAVVVFIVFSQTDWFPEPVS